MEESMARKKGKKKAERKIDMAEHEYRLKTIGLSDRAVKLLVRSLILIVPVILIVYWIMKTA